MSIISSWSQLKESLRERGFRPNPSRGQNFLLSTAILNDIVRYAQVAFGDNVLEVGVGAGSLTGALLRTGAKVLGIEIEHKLASLTMYQYKKYEQQLTLMNTDVLEKGKRLNPAVENELAKFQASGGYKLVANLPYNISTPFMTEIMHASVRPKIAVIVVQRDFAERLCASPGSRQYSPLSVISSTFGLAEILRSIDARQFWPEPPVESVAVRWRPHEVMPKFENEDLFFAIVSASFMMRRKKLSNVIKHLSDVKKELFGDNPAAAFEEAGIDLDRRAEETDPKAFERIYRAVVSIKKA